MHLVTFSLIGLIGANINAEDLRSQIIEKFEENDITADSTTLIAVNVETYEVVIGTGKKFGYKLDKQFKVIARAAGQTIEESITQFLEVDAKLRINPEIAQGLGRLFNYGYGDNYVVGTAAMDTKYATKVTMLEQNDNSWTAYTANHLRSFDQNLVGKFAVQAKDGGVSVGISPKKFRKLVTGASAFKQMYQFNPDARLVRAPMGYNAAICNVNVDGQFGQNFALINLDKHVIYGKSKGILVPKIGQNSGLLLLRREEDNSVIDESFAMDSYVDVNIAQAYQPKQMSAK